MSKQEPIYLTYKMRFVIEKRINLSKVDFLRILGLPLHDAGNLLLHFHDPC